MRRPESTGGSRVTSMRQGFFKRMFGAEEAPRVVLPAAERRDAPPGPPRLPSSPFGEFGEKGEKVGEQISYFISRLDELYSLRQEFSLVAKPMQEFIVSHAEAQTRLAEATALLARERMASQAARTEGQALRTSQVQLENTLAEANNQIRLHEDAAGTRSAQLKSLELSYDDATSRLDWATRQLAAEAQTNAGHADALRVMNDDLNDAEQELALERARGLEVRDKLDATSTETRRLQMLVERLQPDLAATKRRLSDIEMDLGAAHATVGMLELKIASEHEMRRSVELARAQEKVTFDNEIAALTIQVEALESRNTTTAKMADQSRSLLNEKIEQLRQVERTVKELHAEKSTADRRYLASQEEIRRLAEGTTALGSRHNDMQERCTMLANAVAAKDAQIEQLNGRCDGLKKQLEDTIARSEQERLSTEGQNRKLIEEVQGERAERALAQGALSIARNSREKLLAQIEDLKRGRVTRSHSEVVQPASEGLAENDSQSNIHRFRAADPAGDGA